MKCLFLCTDSIIYIYIYHIHIHTQKCSVKEGEVVYELLASVAHIREPKTGGNLVAHVHVGETYHQRKEGVTTTQFYLFNDFSIVDIEKV